VIYLYSLFYSLDNMIFIILCAYYDNYNINIDIKKLLEAGFL